MNGQRWNGEDAADGAAVGGGRLSHYRAEESTERPQALVAHREANFGHRDMIASQQLFGAVAPPAPNELVRGFSKGASKHAVIVIGGETGNAGGVIQTYGLVDRGGQEVAGTAQTREGFFFHQGAQAVERRCTAEDAAAGESRCDAGHSKSSFFKSGLPAREV